MTTMVGGRPPKGLGDACDSGEDILFFPPIVSPSIVN